jgi:hypothetical protein
MKGFFPSTLAAHLSLAHLTVVALVTTASAQCRPPSRHPQAHHWPARAGCSRESPNRLRPLPSRSEGAMADGWTKTFGDFSAQAV